MWATGCKNSYQGYAFQRHAFRDEIYRFEVLTTCQDWASAWDSPDNLPMGNEERLRPPHSACKNRIRHRHIAVTPSAWIGNNSSTCRRRGCLNCAIVITGCYLIDIQSRLEPQSAWRWYRQARVGTVYRTGRRGPPTMKSIWDIQPLDG